MNEAEKWIEAEKQRAKIGNRELYGYLLIALCIVCLIASVVLVFIGLDAVYLSKEFYESVTAVDVLKGLIWICIGIVSSVIGCTLAVLANMVKGKK